MFCKIKLKRNALLARPISLYLHNFLPCLQATGKTGWSCWCRFAEWYFYFLFFDVFSFVADGDWLSRGNGWSGINGELRRFGSPGFGNCWPNDGRNPRRYCGWKPTNGRKAWPDNGFWNGKGNVWVFVVRVFVVTVEGGLALQPVGFPLPITQQAMGRPAFPDTKLSWLFPIPRSSGCSWSWRRQKTYN